MSFFSKFRAFQIRVPLSRHNKSQLIWFKPRLDDRAEPHLKDGGSGARAGTEAAMHKFGEVLEHALWGNYDYPEKLAHVNSILEQLRIDMLNFDRIREKMAA